VYRDGKVEIVRALIEAKADVKAANTKNGDQPVNIAVHLRGTYISMVFQC